MSPPIMAAGPRALPADGFARVWIDIGSGPGYVREVRCDQLTLAEIDDGRSSGAIYVLHPVRGSSGGCPSADCVR
ncbi:hypothetical protein Axi01nite_37240 [Actinoplanes xinjiangensis]|nr:hypothetical protein Axi01nite_37240 [Actinoplanes xinjiangensis]